MSLVAAVVLQVCYENVKDLFLRWRRLSPSPVVCSNCCATYLESVVVAADVGRDVVLVEQRKELTDEAVGRSV